MMKKEPYPAKKASQGTRNTRVVLILAASLILVGLAWFGSSFYADDVSTPPVNVGTTVPATQ